MNDATANPTATGLDRRALLLMVVAAAILMITMGMRQSLGLFIAPIIDSTHVGYASMSLAMAVGQLMWGVAQPTFGALADRRGANIVLVIGALMLAAGSALTPFATHEFALIATIGVLTAAGAGAGSFAVLIGVVAQRVPAHKRSVASGFVNAGGSLGQFVFAPLNQFLISSITWMGAMWTMAGAALATIPLARLLTRKPDDHGAAASHAATRAAPITTALTMRQQLAIAARDKSYWCLHAGFFTCGFHIAFLVTHLPGEVKLCSLPATVASTSLSIIGLANVAGSLWAGWAGGVMRMKYLLFWNYFSRAAAIAIYIAAPKTAVMFRDSVDAYVREDAQAARAIIPQDEALDKMNAQVSRQLIDRMARDPEQLRGYINLMFIARHLERVGDHATNIAEDAVYAVAAEDIRHQQIAAQA